MSAEGYAYRITATGTGQWAGEAVTVTLGPAGPATVINWYCKRTRAYSGEYRRRQRARARRKR